jgi:hypothetical protein
MPDIDKPSTAVGSQIGQFWHRGFFGAGTESFVGTTLKVRWKRVEEDAMQRIKQHQFGQAVTI